MRESKTLKWILIFVGSIIIFLISFTVIYDLLIPDVCYYHEHEMNTLMSFFYSAGGGDNGHPEPNLFNFIFSLFIGGLIGLGIYRILTKKNRHNKITTANNN